MVYDYIHKNGIPYDDWIGDFHAPSGYEVTKSDF